MISAVGTQGVVILTCDEDDKRSHNNILTVFAGSGVRAGYTSSTKITHYTIVRTICDALRLNPFALATSETPITDVWLGATPVALRSWGQVKTIYRGC